MNCESEYESNNGYRRFDGAEVGEISAKRHSKEDGKDAGNREFGEGFIKVDLGTTNNIELTEHGGKKGTEQQTGDIGKRIE